MMNDRTFLHVRRILGGQRVELELVEYARPVTDPDRLPPRAATSSYALTAEFFQNTKREVRLIAIASIVEGLWHSHKVYTEKMSGVPDKKKPFKYDLGKAERREI